MFKLANKVIDTCTNSCKSIIMYKSLVQIQLQVSDE